MRAHNIT